MNCSGFSIMIFCTWGISTIRFYMVISGVISGNIAFLRVYSYSGSVYSVACLRIIGYALCWEVITSVAYNWCGL